MFNHIKLESGVSLRGINDDDVHLKRMERGNAQSDWQTLFSTTRRQRKSRKNATKTYAGLDQCFQTDLVVGARANRRSTKELLVGAFGGIRVVTILLQVLAGDQTHKLAVRVDNGQLAMFTLAQDRVCFFKCAVVLGSD